MHLGERDAFEVHTRQLKGCEDVGFMVNLSLANTSDVMNLISSILRIMTKHVLTAMQSNANV